MNENEIIYLNSSMEEILDKFVKRNFINEWRLAWSGKYKDGKPIGIKAYYVFKREKDKGDIDDDDDDNFESAYYVLTNFTDQLKETLEDELSHIGIDREIIVDCEHIETLQDDSYKGKYIIGFARSM